MYLINSELTVNWILSADLGTIALADLDVILKASRGNSTYSNNGILAEDFLSPDLNNNGYASYKFTPNLKGLWLVALTDGTESEHTFYYEHKIVVTQNDTVINKRVRGTLF